MELLPLIIDGRSSSIDGPAIRNADSQSDKFSLLTSSFSVSDVGGSIMLRKYTHGANGISHGMGSS
jgi:hypothetical protein